MNGFRFLALTGVLSFGLAAFATFAVPSASADQHGFRFRVVVPDQLADDESFQAFLERLHGLIEARDAEAVYDLVHRRFFYFRDFGGMHNPGDSARNNFIRVFPLKDENVREEYHGFAWHSLEAMIADGKVETLERDGKVNYCAPSWPRSHQLDGFQTMLGDDYWFTHGYARGEGVNLRAAPGLDARVLDVLNYEPVRFGPYRNDDANENQQADGITWVPVATVGADPITGYVARAFLYTFLEPQLCFRKVAGRWLISGYVGGGD